MSAEGRNVRYSLYDQATGLFMGRTISVPANALAANIPQGCQGIAGDHDHLSRRVDLATGAVVDYQPPAPDDEHEWDGDAKRWQRTAASADVLQRRAAAAARIHELDARSLPVLRKAYLGDGAAQAELRAIDDEITTLEKDL